MKQFYRLVVYNENGTVSRTRDYECSKYRLALKKCRGLSHHSKIFYCVNGEVYRCAYSNFSEVEE